MNIRFFPGEAVKIKVSDMLSKIIEIKLYECGAAEYVVRWWNNGQTNQDTFSESELESIQPHEEIKIGFNKNKSCILE